MSSQLAIEGGRSVRKGFGYRYGDFPNAEYTSEGTVSLPLSAKMTEADVEDVIKAVRKVINYFKK